MSVMERQSDARLVGSVGRTEPESPAADVADVAAGTDRRPESPATPAETRPLGLIRRLIRSRRDFERTVQVVNKAGRFLLQSALPRMAAALSYRTIFGLVPTLVIGIAVLGSFATEETMQNTLRQLLVYTGISEIVIDEEAAIEARSTVSGPGWTYGPWAGPGAVGPSAPPVEATPNGSAGGEVVAGPGASDPESGGSAGARASEEDGSEVAPARESAITPGLEDWISTIVTRVRGIAFQAVGAIGVLTLIYAAGSMLIEIERAFNDIYHAPTGRPWGRRIQLYWTMLTLGIILVITTFFIGARATAWLAGLTSALGPGTALGTLLTFVATVLTSTVLLLALYLWVPNTRVAFRPAVAGAFVAALLWETSKLGLQRYIELSTSYAKLYGSLGLLPLLLIWIYVTWLILLFGLQVAYALQNFHTWRAEDERRDAVPPVVEPAAILAVAMEIARGFLAGRSTRVSDLGSKTGVDERVVLLMTERLAAAGVVHRVEDQDRTLTLARPAETVALGDLLRMGFEMSGPSQGVGAELREQSVRALGERTLASAVGVVARGVPGSGKPVGVVDEGVSDSPRSGESRGSGATPPTDRQGIDGGSNAVSQ